MLSDEEIEKELERIRNMPDDEVFEIQRWAWGEFEAVTQNENGEVVARMRHAYFRNHSHTMRESVIAGWMDLENNHLELSRHARAEGWKNGPEPAKFGNTHELRAEFKAMNSFYAGLRRRDNARQALMAVQAEKQRLGIELDTVLYKKEEPPKTQADRARPSSAWMNSGAKARRRNPAKRLSAHTV